ncbi:MAG: hypothetical protein ABS76_00905 [Pelagibacterium sp. SCN 64-44]|nr:MAG: hypothetical protein ABS76_00905 [Pelagibacterium sp. SCN 64-44]
MITAKYLVIGAGLTGAAIAWRLAQSGAGVAILEQSLPASVQGSSHSSARVFRYTNLDAHLVGLAKRALEGWFELEKVSGNRIVHVNGALDFGAAQDVKGLARVLAGEAIEHEILSSADAGKRWPAIRFDTDVLWHPGAALIDSEVGVWGMVGAAQRLGAELVTEFTVTRVEKTDSGYRLHAEDGRVAEGEEVIVAAGGRLPDFLAMAPVPSRLAAAIRTLEVRQQHVYHFPYRTQPEWGEAPWPSVIHKVVGREVHCLPGRRDSGYAGQKIYYDGGKLLGPAAVQDIQIDRREHDLMIDYVAGQFPGLGTEPFGDGPCITVTTPQGAFLVEREAGFTIAVPNAGHGAQFAPVLGELVVELVNGRRDAALDAPKRADSA